MPGFLQPSSKLIAADDDKRQVQFAILERIMNQLDYEVLHPIHVQQKKNRGNRSAGTGRHTGHDGNV